MGKEVPSIENFVWHPWFEGLTEEMEAVPYGR